MTYEGQNMWQAVLLEAVRDLYRVKNKDRSHVKRRDLLRKQAETWFRDAGPDFRLVCELAGVDPDVVKRVYDAGELHTYANMSRVFRGGKGG